MSQANIPNITPDISLSREQALNMIIASIAMEELGLSHVINAEGEKLQYVLGTLQGGGTLPESPTIDDLLDVNDSIRNTLRAVSQNEMLLRDKLETAIDAAYIVPPIGPTGPVGPTGATGPDGATGATGPTGAQGAEGPTGENGITGVSGLQGLPGPQGAQGPEGLPGTDGSDGVMVDLSIMSEWDPTEVYFEGDVVKYNNEIYLVVDTTLPGEVPATSSNYLHLVGDSTLYGPTGATGHPGAQGSMGPTGAQGTIGATGPTGSPGPGGVMGAPGVTGATGPNAMNQTTIHYWLPVRLFSTTQEVPESPIVQGDLVYNGTFIFMAMVNNPTTPPIAIIGPDGKYMSADSNYYLIFETGDQGVTGAQGAQGPTGPTGITGPTGPVAVTGAPGEPGATGAPGAAGAIGLTGTTGAPGVTGAPGAQGPAGQSFEVIPFTSSLNAEPNQMIVYMNRIYFNLGPIINGDPVPPLPGDSDPYFINIYQIGVTGPTGATGATGAMGIGTRGPTGSEGLRGPRGATGVTGATGEAGLGILPLTFYPPTSNYTLGQAIYRDGSTYAVIQVPVPPGETPTPDSPYFALVSQEGPAGLQGPIGNTGITGAVGSSGPTGERGDTGAQGLAGLTGVQGATGIAGQPGATGATGTQGAIGDTGPAGETAEAGPTGPQGVTGTTGVTGPTGPIGPTGLPSPQPFMPTMAGIQRKTLISIPSSNTLWTFENTTVTLTGNDFAFEQSGGLYTGIRILTSGLYRIDFAAQSRAATRPSQEFRMYPLNNLSTYNIVPGLSYFVIPWQSGATMRYLNITDEMIAQSGGYLIQIYAIRRDSLVGGTFGITKLYTPWIG